MAFSLALEQRIRNPGINSSIASLLAIHNEDYISESMKPAMIRFWQIAVNAIGMIIICNGDLTINNNMTEVTDILDNLLVGYDRQIRPDPPGNTTGVKISIQIRSMGPVSELEMNYKFDCYFRQYWVDKRLAHSFPHYIQVANRFIERIWRPDTHFVNGRHSYLHTITVPNSFVRISPAGEVSYSMRLTIKANCPMELHDFPMDIQFCPVALASCGYTPDEIEYRWKIDKPGDKPVGLSSEVALSQYDLIGSPRLKSSIVRPFGSQPAGRSLLHVQFVLRRRVGHFLINLYVPCSLLVILSWVAFWLNREATSDRINLGITTVLNLVLLVIDSRVSLPKVPYATALDWFVFWCFFFVISSLVEFAFVHHFTKYNTGDPELALYLRGQPDPRRKYQSKAKRLRMQMENNRKNQGYSDITFIQRVRDFVHDNLIGCLLGDKIDRSWENNDPDHMNSVSQIDKVSRLLFPLSFALYNVYYWAPFVNTAYYGDDRIANN